MAMGTRKDREEQEELWVPHTALPKGASHPFYQRLNQLLEESPPDHSTISRTRRLIDVETHREVFTWVLGVLAEKGLLKGQTLGIDATTLEANAALRTIVRRDTGEGYQEFLKRLAQESGI